MRKRRLAIAFLIACLAGTTRAHAMQGPDDDSNSQKPFTVAAFGDWPYGDFLLKNASRLVDSINSYNEVTFVLHVGDIHSGSQPCTSAGIVDPIIQTSNPAYNQQVYYQFQQFKAPVIYTPGDNEWTDCHKTKELSSGDPLKELASVRTLFFARPGHTLGLTDKEISTQAQHFDPAHPEDGQFVENVMWRYRHVVFVTVNMPGGSNNDDPDTAPWTAPFTNYDAQLNEMTQRNSADIAWLETAFDEAKDPSVRAVVVALQADLWDPEKPNELGEYTQFVQKLADLSVEFGRPVLLINGDTHSYLSDRPLADPNSVTGLIHHTQPVPNLKRVVVQGSTNDPAEWLRLTIDPRKRDPFSWSNVSYCAHPSLSSCD